MTYRAKNWDKPCRVIAKIEWYLGELFPLCYFIVTNSRLPAFSVVKVYNRRGNVENRIKEGKNTLGWDKTSCHRFAANEARLKMGFLAYNLLHLIRRFYVRSVLACIYRIGFCAASPLPGCTRFEALSWQNLQDGLQKAGWIGISEIHKKRSSDRFGGRIYSMLKDFDSVSNLQTNVRALKTGNCACKKAFLRLSPHNSDPYKIIDDVDLETLDLLKKFLIDFDTRLLRPSKDSLARRAISIKNAEHIEQKMVMQGVDEGVEGVDDALTWSLTISKKDGKTVLSASGLGVAYVVFGVCTPIWENQ